MSLIQAHIKINASIDGRTHVIAARGMAMGYENGSFHVTDIPLPEPQADA